MNARGVSVGRARARGFLPSRGEALAAALAAVFCLLSACTTYVTTVVGDGCYARRAGAGEGSGAGAPTPAGDAAAAAFSDVGCRPETESP